MSVRVYVEGGGDYKHTDTATACRSGFRQLFEKLGLPARRLSVIACGSRGQTFKDFRTAVRQEAADFVILLVDSEGPLEGAVSSWAHLAVRDKWRPPAITTEDQAHLMVQCMEAWFLADKDVLGHFYGQGFLPSSLPHRPDIEQVPRVELLRALRQAFTEDPEGRISQDQAWVRNSGCDRSAEGKSRVAPRRQVVRRIDSRGKPVSHRRA